MSIDDMLSLYVFLALLGWFSRICSVFSQTESEES